MRQWCSWSLVRSASERAVSVGMRCRILCGVNGSVRSIAMIRARAYGDASRGQEPGKGGDREKRTNAVLHARKMHTRSRERHWPRYQLDPHGRPTNSNS